MKDNVIVDKTLEFSIRIVNMYKYLCKEQSEFILSKQLLKSGTSIGANVREAEHAQSKADFLNKNNIALKEANETCYWLELLHKTGYITTSMYDSIFADCEEILKILISIVKTSKQDN